jgi:hypothetical protein
MAYTTIDKPTDYFNTVLYTGNGAASRAITGVGFQPDWVWVKSRSGGYYHGLWDSVRTNKSALYSNATDAEDTTTGGTLGSLNSDGFTTPNVAGGGFININAATYASWNWKAGTSFTNDASATGIGTIDSTGSVNETAGFSICSYTGTGSNGTIKHGLSTVPHMIIQKNLTSGTHAWNVYHKNLTSAVYNLNLDGTYAEFTSATTWNSTAPTSSVFSVGTDTNANESGSGQISYIFSERKGYSKFGSYVGNGSATNGTFVYTGFKPAFVMSKRTNTAENWYMKDNKRDTFNPVDNAVYANSSAAELSNWGGATTDYLSNGFKLRTTDTAHNGSGSTYIYMAFAENPFTTSTGVPATAR